MTDHDEVLHYLLNKLKSEDGWSNSNLTWNEEKLTAVISDQFSSFDGVLKAKVLLYFLSTSPHTINQVLASCLTELRCMHTHAFTHMHTYTSFLGLLTPQFFSI